MSVLAWGKPTVEYGPSIDGAPATVFETMPEIKEGTAKLTTTAGTTTDAKEEGGDRVDFRTGTNTYMFEFELFQKSGDTKPITDTDGVILTEHTVRLTPEDTTVEGFIIDRANVQVTESWSSADGTLWKYTFNALKPATGTVLKQYLKPVV